MTVFSVMFGSPSLFVCIYSQCLVCGYYKDSKMVLTSTGVLLVEWAPPECLLPVSVYPGSVPVAPASPLWEVLQDRQASLTQVPFTLVLLLWVLECVKFSMHLLRVEALFPIALWGFPKPAPLAFKAKHSGGSYSQSRSPGLGSPMWDSDSDLCNWLSSHLWVIRQGVGVLTILHVPSLPPSCCGSISEC